MKATLTDDQYNELESVLDDGDLRSDYSGRSMYGRTCVGFTTDESPARFQQELAKILAPDYFGEEEPDADSIDEMMDEIGSPNSDSMGRSTIYYYPSISVEGQQP